MAIVTQLTLVAVAWLGARRVGEVHELVNERMTTALARIDYLERLLAGKPLKLTDPSRD